MWDWASTLKAYKNMVFILNEKQMGQNSSKNKLRYTQGTIYHTNCTKILYTPKKSTLIFIYAHLHSYSTQQSINDTTS